MEVESQGGTQPPVYQPSETSGKAIAALVLGLVGISMFPVIPSILAIIYGAGAKREIAASGGRLTGEGLATTGVVLGWIALGLAALGIIGFVLLVAGGLALG